MVNILEDTQVIFVKFKSHCLSRFFLIVFPASLCLTIELPFLPLCPPPQFPRFPPSQETKISAGVSGPKFALTNHTSCCDFSGGIAFRMIQRRVGVRVALSHLWGCCHLHFVGVLLLSRQTYPHILTHRQCAWNINAFGNISKVAAASAKD